MTEASNMLWLVNVDALSNHIQGALRRALRALYPATPDVMSLVRVHVWRDRRYVGDHAGKVLAWEGFSANLRRIDSRMRTVYVDFVPHNYDQAMATELFGAEFALKLRETGPAVVTYVLDFPVDASAEITRAGFVPRIMGRTIHASAIASIGEYLATNPASHASTVIELLMLQKALANERRAIHGVEVALQHLLHQSGFLATYLLSQRLEVVSIDAPRKAGDFGHDLEARVRIRGESPEYRLGIEVYLQGIGYHRDTIPSYASRFNLNAMMVVAPRDPWPDLALSFASSVSAHRLNRLNQMADAPGVGVHHLPLSKVIDRLAQTAGSIDAIWPNAAGGTPLNG